jgi:hypothetical protein
MISEKGSGESKCCWWAEVDADRHGQVKPLDEGEGGVVKAETCKHRTSANLSRFFQ